MDKNDRSYALAAELTSKLTLDEKLSLLSTHHHAVERLGMNEFYIGQEVARGFVGREPEHYSTVFPQPIGLAGTFDRELMRELGEIAGNECRAFYNKTRTGGGCVWGPTVDMERDPRWGRNEEAYGEDVFLAGEMTAAYTSAMAGDNGTYLKTIPTLKHFCANNSEESRVKGNSFLPLRIKYEYYYAAFMNAIRFGGARSVMAAYNEINGVPAMLNPELKTVLKDKWGLWFTVTDGGDFSQTVTFHRYCDSHAEVLAEALKAGCDTMTDIDSLVKKSAEKALARGLLTEEDIDETVRNVLYARCRLGHFADDCPYDSITYDDVDTAQSQEVNLRAALEQVTLLKNDGTLPLRDISGKIAVCGPLADEVLRDWYTGTSRETVSVLEGMRAEFPQCGIVHDSLWDIVAVRASNGKYLSAKDDGTVSADADIPGESELFEMQDWGEGWVNLFSVKYKRYLRNTDGRLMLHNRGIYDWFTRETFNLFPHESSGETVIEEYLGHQRLTLNGVQLGFEPSRTVRSEGLFTVEVISSGTDRARNIAAECGTVVYCTGNYPVQVAKECFDRKTLALNVQPNMALELNELNPRTVMVIVSSYPYSVNREDKALPAILWTSHAGPHLGTAVARTLNGKNPPSGRLAQTWYRSELDLPDINDYDIESAGTTYMYFRGEPLYPFGFGLSYADFRYSGLSVRRTSDGAEAVVDIENVSGTDSAEVIQIYFTVRDSEVTRPLRKLCGFARVFLKAGEKQTVRVTVPEHILQIYDVRSGEMMTEGGVYTFLAGRSSADIRAQADLAVEGKKLSLRGSTFNAQSFDKAHGISIFWSRRFSRNYVRGIAWDCGLTYGGIDFTGCTRVKLSAAAVTCDGTIYADICGKKVEISVSASDSFDDFAEYEIAIPEGVSGVGTLEICLPEFMAVMDITIK